MVVDVIPQHPGSEVAFVHTLDLQNKYTVCIDLPSGSGDLDRLKDYNLALSPDGLTLYATNAVLGVVAEVDLNTLQVVRTVEFTPDSSGCHRGYPSQAPTRHSVLSKDGRSVYFTSGTGIWVYEAAAQASVWAVLDGCADRWPGLES